MDVEKKTNPENKDAVDTAPKLVTPAENVAPKESTPAENIPATAPGGTSFIDDSVNMAEPTTTASSEIANAPVITAQPNNATPKSAKGKKIGIALAIIAVAAVFAAGGIFAGRTIFADKDSSKDGIVVAPEDQEYIPEDGAGEPVKDIAPISTEDNLTLAFLKLHNDRENSCYSPLSIRYALEMLSLGASGETKAQIDKLLGDHKAKHYTNIADHLALANSMWVLDGLQDKVQHNFTDQLEKDYGMNVYFDPLVSAGPLNTWVKDNTMGMLENVFSDADLEGLQAALVNVLALDMNWEEEFPKDMTQGQYFDYAENKEDEEMIATTMHFSSGYKASEQTGFYYGLSSKATILAMDLKKYEDTQLQFVAFMPDDLQNFVNEINIDRLNLLMSGMRAAKAQNDTYNFSFNAYIPKFKISGGLPEFIDDLKTLGMQDAFDHEKADFSKMVEIQNFAIDAALHKTVFDFSEEGIKAAAITAFGGRGSAGGPAPIPNQMHVVVSINKPFLYLVRDKDNGEIWFVGTVYQPNLWKDDRATYGYSGDSIWGYSGQN